MIDDDPLNAVSLPGGYIYIFRGILDHAENDDQLAGVIAHEVGHITARHGVKRMQSAYAAMIQGITIPSFVTRTRLHLEAMSL